MLLYNYSFCVVAAILCVTILVLFYHRRPYMNHSSSVFLTILWITLIYSLVDIVTVYVISRPESFSVFGRYFYNILCLSMANLQSVFFLMYIMIIVNGRSEGGKPMEIFMDRTMELRNKSWSFINLYLLAAIILILGLILTTPFTGWVFYFDDELNYLHGTGMSVLYVVSFICAVWAVILLLINARRFTAFQVISVVAFTLLMLAGVIVQYYFPSYLVGEFTGTLLILILYVNFEDTAYFMYQNSGCYNSSTFYAVVRDMMVRNRNYPIFTFKLVDFESLAHFISADEISGMVDHIARLMQRDYLGCVYMFNDSTFVLLPDFKALHITNIHDCVSNVDRIVNHCQTARKYHLDIKISVHQLDTQTLKPYYRNLEEMMTYICEATANTDEEIVLQDVYKKAHRETQINHIIDKAIANEGFDVHFQPIYSVGEKRCTMAEALVRLFDTELGFIPPMEIVELAEKTGKVTMIDEIVLKKTCQFINDNELDSMGLSCIDVNLSVGQCMRPGAAKRILEIIDSYGIDHSRINLEITETEELNREPIFRENMEILKAAGMTFSLDDYGSGFSSPSHLMKMPIDIVKVDKSILWAAMKSPKAMTIFLHTIRMLKELDLKVVVEGAEDEEMTKLLVDNGCDFIQGYYFARPMASPLFLKTMKAN